jgi:hypothetical protein
MQQWAKLSRERDLVSLDVAHLKERVRTIEDAEKEYERSLENLKEEVRDCKALNSIVYVSDYYLF